MCVYVHISTHVYTYVCVDIICFQSLFTDRKTQRTQSPTCLNKDLLSLIFSKFLILKKGLRGETGTSTSGEGQFRGMGAGLPVSGLDQWGRAQGRLF